MKGGFLTIEKMNFSHFASRTRAVKNESGEKIGVKYDRLFTGLRVEGRDWLESHYNDKNAVVNVFMLGDKNVVFTHLKGDNKMFVNKNANKQARVYVEFYARESGVNDIVEVDDLPTAIHTRQGAGSVATIDQLIDKALNNDIDCGL